jgi:beta-mannosidase
MTIHRSELMGAGIQEADWTFKTTFEVTSSQLDEACADLVFEGLDTYCDISLVRMTLNLSLREDR